mmetsp:Transcript_26557/g.36571  ORF Transcript_26557/g.36571 Transcript_26557/m.36571 type:complete len:258 (-) Transcript_26557:907-1680(-)
MSRHGDVHHHRTCLHTRVDPLEGVRSSHGFLLPALAVCELEETLPAGVGEGHAAAVQQGQQAHPPPQQRAGHCTAQSAGPQQQHTGFAQSLQVQIGPHAPLHEAQVEVHSLRAQQLTAQHATQVCHTGTGLHPFVGLPAYHTQSGLDGARIHVRRERGSVDVDARNDALVLTQYELVCPGVRQQRAALSRVCEGSSNLSCEFPAQSDDANVVFLLASMYGEHCEQVPYRPSKCRLRTSAVKAHNINAAVVSHRPGVL